MNNITKVIGILLLTISLLGCKKEDTESLFKGQWHLYRYFIDDIDVTNEKCHNSVYFDVKDDKSIDVKFNAIECNNSFVIPAKLYYTITDNILTLEDDDEYGNDIKYPSVEIILITRTEMELIRKESGYSLRYVLNRVK